MHSGSLARVREMPPDDRVTGCECSDPIAGRAASPATLPTDVLAYAASPGKDGRVEPGRDDALNRPKPGVQDLRQYRNV